MYKNIYSIEDKKFVSLFSEKGKFILKKYLTMSGGSSSQAESKTRADETTLEEIYSMDPNSRILRSFEQPYENTFWVSCHGVYEDSSSFVVPPGCKLIFTTWLGKLGEGDNYQENEIFRDLQVKNPVQFVESGKTILKDRLLYLNYYKR